MLHKPTTFLSTEHSEKVYNVLKEYCDHGGLHGVLDPDSKHREFLGSSPRDFLTGRAARTVIITNPNDARVPRQVERVVQFSAKRAELSPPLARERSTRSLAWEWEGESKNRANNVLIRKGVIEGATLPTKTGIARKRGQLITSYKDRFFVLVNGCLFYYLSEVDFLKGSKVRPCVVNVKGAPYLVAAKNTKQTYSNFRGETYRLQNFPKISCAAGRRCGGRGEVEVEQECSNRPLTNAAVYNKGSAGKSSGNGVNFWQELMRCDSNSKRGVLWGTPQEKVTPSPYTF